MSITTDRADTLMSFGLKFNGEEYAKDDFNVHWTEIKCDSDDEFNGKVEKIKAEMERRKSKPDNTDREQRGCSMLANYQYDNRVDRSDDGQESDIIDAISDLLHYAACRGDNVDIISQNALIQVKTERGI